MSDFQVMLFIGAPTNEALRVVLPSISQESVLTSLQCECLGPDGQAVQELLDSIWPDLICVFADDLEARGEDVLGFCSRIRERWLRYRPVLIVQSGVPEEKRIQYLLQGADDILGPDLSPDEFSVRLLAHLRRNLDVTVHDVTRLPGLQFTSKVTQRRLNQQKPVALMIVEVDHLDVYNEVYGEKDTAEVLKILAALLVQLAMMPDFVTHTDENHFVIVTRPDKAEKLAALICRQFEAASPNFYSEQDRRQGYMTSVIAGNISRRVPLLSLSIGAASTETQPFASFTAIFNASQQMKMLAKMKPGSAWQSDRLRLSGDHAPVTQTHPGVLVLETDAALAYLLKTTLEMEGYDVEVVSTVEDARMALTEKADRLNLVILDALIHEEEAGLALAREIYQQYPDIRMICASSLHDRRRVLEAGAHLYLPKPFELSSLFSWIHRLLKEAD